MKTYTLRMPNGEQYVMTDDIIREMNESVHNNLAEVRLTISAMPVPMCTNIRAEDLSEITKAATANCAATCMKTREESKRCPLRHALETIPGMKEAARNQAFGLSGCPYMTI